MDGQTDGCMCLQEVFACEIDPQVKAVLMHNFQHLSDSNVFHDAMKLNMKLLRRLSPPKELDVFSAGFPCQPFSTSGIDKGVEDQRGCNQCHLIWLPLPRLLKTCPLYLLHGLNRHFFVGNGNANTIKGHLQARPQIHPTECWHCMFLEISGFLSGFHAIEFIREMPTPIS